MMIYPRDKIAEIAHENGWHRSVDLGDLLVDVYTLGGRCIYLKWSFIERAIFVKIDVQMLTHQHADVVTIDGHHHPDTAAALDAHVSAAFRKGATPPH